MSVRFKFRNCSNLEFNFCVRVVVIVAKRPFRLKCIRRMRSGVLLSVRRVENQKYFEEWFKLVFFIFFFKIDYDTHNQNTYFLTVSR